MPPRPSPLAAGPRARGRRSVTAAVAALLVLLATSWVLVGRGHDPQPATVPAPWEYTAPAWQAALGGDTVLGAAAYRSLDDYADPHLSVADRTQLRELAAQVTRADLTGADRARFTGYWPPAAAAPARQRCTGLRLLATAPTRLPTVAGRPGVDRYAKVLTAAAGHCDDGAHTARAPLVSYVYVAHTGRGWIPVHSWQVPAPAEPATDPQAAAEPAAWELKEFSSCGAPGQVFRDRIMVVDAFDQMCADAHAAGVPLRVTAAFRTRAEQAALFDAAVDSYGSEEEARRWVAYADASVCTSRHCTGVALNVAPTSAAMGWLEGVVGCNDGSQVVAAASCPDGSVPVPRMARYGFAAPLAAIPGYLEFTLPADPEGGESGSLSAPDCDPQGVPTPNQVAAVFRCRLGRDGVVGPEQDRVVAQAMAVSRCESGWNPAARAYGGRFATSANPVDGRRYTQAGVFMIPAELADAGWVEGGAGHLTDAVANINAAASLWLATRGWEQFGCATGAAGGFEHGPVLPAYGGPPIPAWAKLY